MAKRLTGNISSQYLEAANRLRSKNARKRIVEQYLGFLGAKIDEERNDVRGKNALISSDDSKVKIFLIPTNEELAIARDTLRLVEA
jgi:acetate kinase